MNSTTEKKSILKSKPSGNPLKQSASTPTKSKKKVEIAASPAQSVKSHEHVSKNSRETPLPRVAFLAPSPISRSKPSQSSKKSTSKKSLSTTATSANKGTKAKGLPKKTKSAKKLKKRKASKSDADVIPHPAPDAGKQYMRELGTINQILRSVTDPTTHSGHEAELIEGFVRPFSADELQQLLTSIGNVASIHQQVPGANAEAEADVLKKLTKIGSTNRQKKSIKADSVKKFGAKGPPPAKASVSLPSMTKTKNSKSKKSLRSSSKSEAKLAQPKTYRSKKITKKKSSTTKSSGAKGAKSSIKSLYKPLKFKSTKSNKKAKKKGGKSSLKKRSSESVLSDLSELDLVKSALLNKRFYEESMALEKMKSSEDVRNKEQRIRLNGSKRRNRAKDLRDEKRKSTKTLQSDNVLIPNLSPISSIIAVSRSRSSSVKSNASDQLDGQAHGYGLKTLEEALAEIGRTGNREEYKNAVNEVLINYSHVIRGPEKKTVTYENPIAHEGKNRGFDNPRPFPYKKEIDLDEVTGFDKHLQKIKYPGVPPMSQGLLDIKPTPKPLSEGSEATGKYLRNERILEETRSKASSGAGSAKKEVKTEVAGSSGVKQKSGKEGSKGDAERKKSKSKSRVKHQTENKIDGIFSNVYKKSIPNPTATFEANVVHEPTIENLTKAPLNWNENSLAQSMDHGIGSDGASRWTTLNQRTVQKNREIKSRSHGRRRDLPKDDLDDIRRKLERSEFSDERKLYLENMTRAREVFDNYNAYYGHGSTRKESEKPQHQTTYGFESLAFDPRSKQRAKGKL